MPRIASAASDSDATRTPMAIARSRPLPALRNPDGARLTVMRWFGHARPLDKIAARTRSRASRQDVSGKPTTVKHGRPTET